MFKRFVVLSTLILSMAAAIAATQKRDEYIKNLTVEDCFSGPNQNKDEPSKLEYFEFGINIKGNSVYIKLSLNLPNKPIDCMSFHIAERPINHPFRKS